MADIIIQNISESDYSAILRQAVAVIDKSRAIVAKLEFTRYNYGQLLYPDVLQALKAECH